MTLAIVKLSYEMPGDPQVVGGICGSAFMVSESVAVTANHVLSPSTFTPNSGFTYVQFFLASRNTDLIVELRPEFLTEFSACDVTVIRDHQLGPLRWRRASLLPLSPGRRVIGEGHIGGAMPIVDTTWRDGRLAPLTIDLDTVKSDMAGSIVRVSGLSVKSADLNISNVPGAELSFGAREGMSGGPVVDESTGRILGMLSFGLPEDQQVKERTFAVAFGAVLQCVRATA